MPLEWWCDLDPDSLPTSLILHTHDIFYLEIIQTTIYQRTEPVQSSLTRESIVAPGTVFGLLLQKLEDRGA